MKTKELGKRVKKLVFQNRFTLEEIGRMLDVPLDVCVKAFESYYNVPIPSSLMIVGNVEVRKRLKNYVKNGVNTLLCGPNGTGKSIALKQLANELELDLIKCVPLKQSDLVISFGKGPLFSNNNHLYIIEADSLPKKKYSIFLKYITESERPIVVVAEDKNKIHKRVLKELKVLHFGRPSPTDVEFFLRKKYNWEGNIRDVYDKDMRVVLSRVLNKKKEDHIESEEPISSSVLAFKIASGFAKLEDFDMMDEPLWWVIRWIAYNQRKKFPKNTNKQVSNLRKLAYIDSKKFYFPEKYLECMLLDLETSQRRTRFSFPPWGKKKPKEEEEEMVTKLKKSSRSKPKQEVPDLKQIDFSKWL